MAVWASNAPGFFGVLVRAIERIEGALLVALFGTLVLAAVYQILARNLWGGGLGWGDAYVRIAVFWITIIGAMVASRSDQHIRIDLLSRYVSDSVSRWITRVTALFTAAIAGIFAWNSAQFVYLEYEDGLIAFGIVPAWLCEIVMPVGFSIIAAKYLVRAVVPPR